VPVDHLERTAPPPAARDRPAADGSPGTRGLWYASLLVLSLWVILNRAVPDLYVLPIGAAIRPSQFVLVTLLIVVPLALLTAPRTWPRGIPALTGLMLLVILTIAPFAASPDYTSYQADGAQRGLILITLYGALFLSAYWVSLQPKAGALLLRLVVLLTVWQAGLVFYEWRGGSGLVNSWPIWSWAGLATDAVKRVEDFRITGLFRPKATAPHPIVMSSLLAIGILVAVIMLIRERRGRRRLILATSLLPMMIAMMLVDARTGYVVLAVGAVAILALQARDLPRFIPLGLAGMIAFGAAAVVFPSAARSTLNLFWNAGSDGSVLVRVDRLNSLPELVAQNPLVGPGWLTNDPKVLLFDNTYALGLIELGIVGIVIYILFLTTAVARMVNARRVASDEELTLILAGIVGGTALLAAGATFDALAFDQFLPTSVFLLGIGLAGADRALRRGRGLPDPLQAT